MHKTLKISPDLALPLEAVTEKLAFLGRTGSGKTYGAQKLAEELYDVGAQFVALDPVGVWYALRLAADGGPGIPVPVFGGLHGDVPLEPTAGRLVADLVADRGISAVLDVSQFESDAAKNRFAKDFGERFFFRKKAKPSAVHLFLEEGQEFVPQNPVGDGDKQVLHVFTRIWKLGRNYGIGGSIITQRPQEVNKKLLNLTEVLFAFQLTGPHERKSVADWIKEKGLDIDVEALLPKLKVGEPHVWSPALLDISKKVRIAKKWTFDASSTPKVGAQAAETKELAPIDLERIRKDMAATIEKAKAEDPKELRRQLAEKEKQIRQLSADSVKLKAESYKPAPAPAPKVIQLPVLEKKQLEQLHAFEAKLSAAAEKIGEYYMGLLAVQKEVSVAIQTAARARLTELPNNNAIKTPLLSRPAPALRMQQVRNTAARASTNEVSTSGNVSTSLPAGERRVLTAIAQHPDGVTREQLTVLTGYTKSSRNTYLQRLGARGYTESAGERILATDAGVAALGSNYEPLPIGDALLQHWRRELPEGERNVLNEVVAVYPDALDRDAISEITGYTKSSRNTYLQRLGARRLVESTRDGIRAAAMLFDGMAP